MPTARKTSAGRPAGGRSARGSGLAAALLAALLAAPAGLAAGEEPAPSPAAGGNPAEVSPAAGAQAAGPQAAPSAPAGTIGEPAGAALDAGIVDAAQAASGIVEGKEKLAEALRAEEAGRKAEALRLYRGWLQEHPRAEGAARVLLHALLLEPGPKEAIGMLQQALGEDPPGREALVRQAGRLLEMTGRVEEAVALYRSAPPLAEFRLRLAALLLEQGEWEEASGILEPLRGLAGGEARGPQSLEMNASRAEDLRLVVLRAEFLAARLRRAQGRPVEAEAIHRRLLAASPAPAFLPEVLLELFGLLEAGRRTAEAEAVLAELESRFRGSPEAAIARGIRGGKAAGGPAAGGAAATGTAVTETAIRLSPNPAELIGGVERVGDGLIGGAGDAPGGGAGAPLSRPAGALPAGTDAKAGPPAGGESGKAAAEKRAVLIQTGSFAVEENAQYMVRDLQRLGYPARILQRDLEGRRYYRVVVDPPAAAEGTQQLLLALKNAGFEGFLLFPE